jgi:diguanylate cyclase (GGDEF)-like protein
MTVAKHILLVDSDEKSHGVVRSVVDSCLDGVRVVVAQTAFEFIDAVREGTYHAVIVDPTISWTTPDALISGLGKHLPDTRVIAFTESPDAIDWGPDVQCAIAKNADDHTASLRDALRIAMAHSYSQMQAAPHIPTIEVMPVCQEPDLLSISPSRAGYDDSIDVEIGLGGMVRNGFPSATFGMGIPDAVVLDVHQPLLDNLTSLPNRALCLNRIGRAIQRSRLEANYGFCVLHLDIDRFQVINDSLGHAAGDELLVQFARRVSAKLRPEDTFGRLAGDEFCILLEPIEGLESAEVVSGRIEDALLQSFHVGHQEVFVTTSIGIVDGSGGYDMPEDIIRDAGLAMYRAKRNGAARHEIFDPGLRDKAVQRLEIDTGLRRALLRSEFELHYQPLVDIETTALVGYEALLRWNSPTLGLVYPDTFIDVAEETGVIVDIGHWVIDAALKALAECPGVEGSPPLTMSVNLSPRQFRCADLADTIKRSLARHDITSDRLILEITEHVFVEHTDVAERTFAALGALGIKIDLDDFGTGFSSLSCLRQFPISRLKIDRSFVEGMTRSARDREIVRAVLELGHNLGKGVIAEGIETRAQLEALRELGCEFGQGYYFARPFLECHSGQYRAHAS